MTQEEIWKENTKLFEEAGFCVIFDDTVDLCLKSLNLGMEIRQNQLAGSNTGAPAKEQLYKLLNKEYKFTSNTEKTRKAIHKSMVGD